LKAQITELQENRNKGATDRFFSIKWRLFQRRWRPLEKGAQPPGVESKTKTCFLKTDGYVPE